MDLCNIHYSFDMALFEVNPRAIFTYFMINKHKYTCINKILQI
jgi:hypothetical protein